MDKKRVTVKSVFDQFGWTLDCCDEVEGDCAANVDIGFYDPSGNVDETQFSIEKPFTDEGVQELSDLFKDFCKENGDPDAVYRVCYAVVVETAPSIDQLS